jgi:predicted nuclease of predicted toxin-antitoxin system
MNFLVDDQLPVALARWIALQGHVAIHVLDVSLSGKDDLIIWRFASNAGCIVVTKDQDFQARRNRERAGPQVVWLRWGNIRKASLLVRFPLVWPVIIECLERGDGIIEIQ